MTKTKRAVALVAISAVMGASIVNVAVAQTSTGKTESEKSKPDKQSSKARDRELSANVRKAIVADKKLSANAHNVKIMTINGTVTLHGPVANSAEKDRLGALAKEVAGVGEVINNVDVPPPRKTRKTASHH